MTKVVVLTEILRDEGGNSDTWSTTLNNRSDVDSTQDRRSSLFKILTLTAVSSSTPNILNKWETSSAPRDRRIQNPISTYDPGEMRVVGSLVIGPNYHPRSHLVLYKRFKKHSRFRSPLLPISGSKEFWSGSLSRSFSRTVGRIVEGTVKDQKTKL